MNALFQNVATCQKFEQSVSILLKLVALCVSIIGVSILFSSCGKTPDDSTPPPAPPQQNLRTQLPVIFHVIYKDKNNNEQYVSATRLKTILNNVNKLYRGSESSVDMNLEFILATTAPNGKTLSAPGVEYIDWTQKYPQNDYPIDYNTLMGDKDGRKYTSMLWDPNQYINVFLYNFTANDNNNVLGVSHLPFIYTDKNAPEGFTQIENPYISLDNLTFVYCVSLNSLFIDHQSTEESHNPSDINVTLAHELGHYLGLHHAFPQDPQTGEFLNNSSDTDYCLDTPSYNRVEYENYYNNAANNPSGGEFTFLNLVKRTNETTTFDSHNIMDYYICYSDQFTDNQRTRIRYILDKGLLMPRVNKSTTISRATQGPIDLPIIIME